VGLAGTAAQFGGLAALPRYGRAVAAAGREGAFLDFAHGTRADFAEDIVTHGLREQAIHANEVRSTSPGSFFTIRVDPDDVETAIQTAHFWGQRHGSPTEVIVMRLPRDAVEKLGRSHSYYVHVYPVEAVFRPSGFDTVNDAARWYWQRTHQ
jgi:hypothetical protein